LKLIFPFQHPNRNTSYDQWLLCIVVKYFYILLDYQTRHLLTM
jgi:hypothetical protein